MRRSSSPRLWLLLALVLGGLVLMHGLDVHGVDARIHDAADAALTSQEPGAPAPSTESLASASAVPGDHASDVNGGVSAPGGQRGGHGALVSIVAFCLAVLVAATGFLLRSPWTVPALTQPPAPPVRWRARLSDTFRPPGPGRLELCIQLC